LQLHKQLYSFAGNLGGSWKNADNVIAETDATGNETVRFRPVSSHLTPVAIEDACSAFNQATDKNEIDRLILIPMFILDFLCIHPFNDGNGRMSRLLTLLLHYQAGYIVGKYISLEKIIEDTKEPIMNRCKPVLTSGMKTKTIICPLSGTAWA
jgi:Fic family protein